MYGKDKEEVMTIERRMEIATKGLSKQRETEWKREARMDGKEGKT